MAHASRRFPAPAYRPTAHSDAAQRASKAKSQQEQAILEAKAVCDLCGVSLGLRHTRGKMWDIRDDHYTWNLKLLCVPCCGRVTEIREVVDPLDYL